MINLIGIILLLLQLVRISDAFLVIEKRIHNHTNKLKRRIFVEASAEGSSSSSSSDNSSNSRSIGDVVQGLHGGKYQFNHPGINYDGQNFAETGYGSGLIGDDEEVTYYDDQQQEPAIPNWALKLQQLDYDDDDDDHYPTIDVSSSSSLLESSIQIKNNERSWEKFYAFIVSDNNNNYNNGDSEDEIVEVVTVEPNVGMLAPRGGKSDNFQDNAVLTVKVIRGSRRSTTTSAPSSTTTTTTTSNIMDKKKFWLVAGTEEDKWIYRICF